MRCLDKVEIEIAVVLGARALRLTELLRLGRGAMLDLDTLEDERITITANAYPIAEGKIVTYPDRRIGVEVTRVLEKPARETAQAN